LDLTETKMQIITKEGLIICNIHTTEQSDQGHMKGKVCIMETAVFSKHKSVLISGVTMFMTNVYN
jgi:hypothetical protein